jgi:hypothetical protein
MRNIQFKLGAVGIILGLLATCTFANASEIAGKYSCKGYDPYLEENYESNMKISQEGSILKFEWETDQDIDGIGFFSNKTNNEVVVGFRSMESDFYGVQNYKIKKDGSLEGNWVANEYTLLGTETCVKSK